MSETEAPDPRNIFVVHGRNRALSEAMFTFLRALDLNPIEWPTALAMTSTGAPYPGVVLDMAFKHAKAVVVLLTPDEVAYLRSEYADGEHDSQTLPATQARPNVLFEAGMALAIHPHHTVFVEIGGVRPFSDVSGRLTIRLTNDAEKRNELVNRLRGAGCAVDTTGVQWLTAGNFTPPDDPGHSLPLGRRVPSTRAPKKLNFDVKYHPGSGGRFGKLQVINHGTQTAFEVLVEFPEKAALSFPRNQGRPVPKIPGGKSVTLNVWDHGQTMGGPEYEESFDMTISARTEDGQPYIQDVFIDTNV